jgi:hypothetical protein
VTRTARFESARLTAILLAALVVSACVQSTEDEQEYDMQEIDFFGIIEVADLSDWRLSPGPFTYGGPDSEQLVGSAEFTLSDGTVVLVPGETPGGSVCDDLARGSETSYEDICVVIGEFTEGNTVGWFGLIWGEMGGSGDKLNISQGMIDISDGQGLIKTPFGKMFHLPLADHVDVSCFGFEGEAASESLELDETAAAYTPLIDPVSHEVTAIECLYSD